MSRLIENNVMFVADRSTLRRVQRSAVTAIVPAILWNHVIAYESVAGRYQLRVVVFTLLLEIVSSTQRTLKKWWHFLIIFRLLS